jgi:hypothetical protein
MLGALSEHPGSPSEALLKGCAVLPDSLEEALEDLST